MVDWELSGSRDTPRDEDDWYIEPPWCVDLLLDAYDFREPIWDPACGVGTIVRCCRERGMKAAGSDLRPRGFGEVHDFLSDDPVPAFVGDRDFSIITNPPFRHSVAFVEQALSRTLARKIAIIAQAKFLYSRARYEFFMTNPPVVILHMSARPSMPPGRQFLAGEIERGGGKLDYCWIVWERGHNGLTQTGWLNR